MENLRNPGTGHVPVILRLACLDLEFIIALPLFVLFYHIPTPTTRSHPYTTMLNFSGSTKRRVVNLGDRREAQKGNFLERSRQERKDRESARLRERAAEVIHSYVSRSLVLQNEAEILAQEILSRSLTPEDQRYGIAVRFISRHGSRSLVHELLPLVVDSLGGIDEFCKSCVFEFLVRALRQNRGSQLALSGLDSLATEPRFPIGKSGGGILGLLQEQLPLADPRVLKVAFFVNIEDSCAAFVEFLASVPLSALSPNSQWLATIRDTILATEGCVQNLLEVRKISLLANIIRIQGEFRPDDYIVHVTVLSTIGTAISRSEDDEADGSIAVSSEAANLLLQLYTLVYLNRALSLLQTSTTPELQNRHMVFLASLMRMFPQAGTKICMIMTLTPGVPLWLFGVLEMSPIYQIFTELSKTDDIMDHSQLLNVLSLEAAGFFWDSLYAYEQLLSYWLIVANDIETFDDNRFSKQAFVAFSGFLKIFLLTLVFRRHDTAFGAKLAKLASASILLLNQIYSKNGRVKVFPAHFWRLKRITFNVDSMLASMVAAQSLDLDDETPSRKHPGLSSSDALAKVQVLRETPFFVDFTDRVKVFQGLIEFDRKNYSNEERLFFAGELESKLKADIHRDAVLVDAFDSYHTQGPLFKNKLMIQFHNEHGPEAGVDGGGLTKEFLTDVVREVFSPENELHLFKETVNNEVYPNNDIFLKISRKVDLDTQQLRLLYLRFVGMIVGKCLYEGILIDVGFAPFFLSKWTSANVAEKSSVNDLSSLDHELFVNLIKLLQFSDEQLDELDMNFTNIEEIDGAAYSFDLVPGGESTSLSASNRLNYIHAIANFKLNKSLAIQTKYFLEGLYDLINASWLRMFDPRELQMLISGGNDVDIKDWKANVKYGGYFDDDTTVALFWEVVDEMLLQERCDLIRFVTSVSRAPLLGFGALYPNFGIQNSGDPRRLPTASTCVNLLKLPDYKDKKLLREKLLYAISAHSGFDLS